MFIKVTPNELKNQSNLVLADIKEIKKHLNAIEDIVNESRNYWEGEAGTEHIRIYQDIDDAAGVIIKRLEETPVKLQTMAGVYDQAETEAQSQASQLPTELF